MPRDTGSSPLTAMQKIQLAAARERLKIDAARARMMEETASESDVEVNQFGRAIVSYEDMPELNEADRALLNLEFQRLACPHWAVETYRPGFGPKDELRKLSRNSWYFYETGQALLRALVRAVSENRIPDLFEKLSSDDFNAVQAMAGLVEYIELEDAAKTEAAIALQTTVETMAAKDKAELAEIRKDLDARYAVIRRRNRERDNAPLKS